VNKSDILKLLVRDDGYYISGKVNREELSILLSSLYARIENLEQQLSDLRESEH